jgi:hypothetical protein
MTAPEFQPDPTGTVAPIDVHRLAAVSSVVDTVGDHVTGLAPIPAAELTDWLDTLTLPAGWQISQGGTGGLPVARFAVWPAPDGGWGACQTLSVFRFTGTVDREVVENSADCTLNDLGATGIFTAVAPPPSSGIAAVRSSGYVRLEGQPLWVRYETYLARFGEEGRLIQHSTFVRAGCRNRLSHDLGVLTDAVHRAFLTFTGDHANERTWLAHTSTSAATRRPAEKTIHE